MTITDAKSYSRPLLTPRLELLFACVGLAIVSVLYRVELVALDPAKWATVSARVLLLVGILIAQHLDEIANVTTSR